jgi:hypothetical protein
MTLREKVELILGNGFVTTVFLLIMGWFVTTRIERFKIVFSKLHGRRAKVVDKLYGFLDDADKAVNDFIKFAEIVRGKQPDKEERRKVARKKVNDLSLFFDKKQIYFSKLLANQIREFINYVKENMDKFEDYILPPDTTSRLASEYDLPPDAVVNRNLEQLEKQRERNLAWEELEKNFVPKTKKLKALIEDEFREIIGVRN